MSGENVEIVRAGLRCLARVATTMRIAGFLDPDIVVITSGGRCLARATTPCWRTTKRWREAWERARRQPSRRLIDARRPGVRVRFDSVAVAERAGPNVEGRFYAVYTMRDGKATALSMYTSEADALEAAGLRE